MNQAIENRIQALVSLTNRKLPRYQRGDFNRI